MSNPLSMKFKIALPISIKTIVTRAPPGFPLWCSNDYNRAFSTNQFLFMHACLVTLSLKHSGTRTLTKGSKATQLFMGK